MKTVEFEDVEYDLEDGQYLVRCLGCGEVNQVTDHYSEDCFECDDTLEDAEVIPQEALKNVPEEGGGESEE